MIKLLVIQLIVLSGGVPWVAFMQDSATAWSFLAGGALLIFSLVIFGVSFGLMFQQKFVALVPALIVSKYAILGILIAKLANFDWVNPIWLGLGFSTIALGGIVYAVDQARQITA